MHSESKVKWLQGTDIQFRVYGTRTDKSQIRKVLSTRCFLTSV
jgi:hypothetical protein